jgi:hypothetical protein
MAAHDSEADGCKIYYELFFQDCLNAIGKHFHPECFLCAYCGKLFGNNPFFLEDGLPYCEAGKYSIFHYLFIFVEIR